MHYTAMLVGQFIKAGEFGTGEIPLQPTWTISRVALEKLESISMNDTDGAAGKLKTKGIVYFKEHGIGWVLNRTNIMCLVEMWGTDTDAWIGKRVTLYRADVRVGAKMDVGVRIKGSPDLQQEITVSVKLPRRKPIPMKLVPTGARATGADDDALPAPAPSALEATFAACTTVAALKAAGSGLHDLSPEQHAVAEAAYKRHLARVRAGS